MVNEVAAPHVKEAYGVEYSAGHACKLLCKAGLSYRTARPRHHEADLEQKREFQRTVKKRPKLSEKTVVVVDQFTKRVGTVQQLGWYPIGSNPSIEMTNSWDKVTALGAVTDDGESFYCWTEDSLEDTAWTLVTQSTPRGVWRGFGSVSGLCQLLLHTKSLGVR